MTLLMLTATLCLLGPTDSKAGGPPSTTGKTHYVCPPCPVDCHDIAFDNPGRCPQCGMTLVEVVAVRNAAILVWDGVELLDFSGPGEVFAAARVGGTVAFNVITISPDGKPITSQGFLKITPDYSIENCPKISVLIIPGGDTRPITQDQKMMSWIKKTSTQTDMILTVCTGAFVLAKAKLLDGIEATTWHGAIASLRKEAPRTKVHDDRRYVDNGDIITSAGVSAGIDGALHALARLTGPDVARKTARYMEYDWRPDVPQGERRAELKRRSAEDPPGVLFDLERSLKEGVREASETLADADLFQLHEDPRFRELIRKNAQRPTATLTTPDEPGESLIVTGRILDQENKPVAAALVYVYHTSKAGVYSTKGGNTASMGDSLNPRCSPISEREMMASMNTAPSAPVSTPAAGLRRTSTTK